MRYPAFVGASHESQSPAADAERLVNAYVERMESPGAASRSALYPVPGVTKLGTALSSPGRANFAENNRHFTVSGSSFVEWDSTGAIPTVRGTVATDSSPAQITSNGDGGGQLLVVSGGNGYYFTLSTNVFTQIAALNGKARQCAYLHGYGLVLDNTTSTFYISALLDFSTFNTGVDFAQRSNASDPWRAMDVNGIYISLKGEHTTEYWYDTGGASFPFAPHPSGLSPYGIAANFSGAVGEGHSFWLGQSDKGQRYVLHTTGFTAEIVSDIPRQRIFDGYATVSDAVGEVINWRGHVFYVLTFPSQAITWAYDLGENNWFEWRTWLAEANDYGILRPRWHTVAFGQHRILDAETGDLYKLDASVFLDVDFRNMRGMRQAPEISSEDELIYFARLKLAIETGVGTALGTPPVIVMQFSDDSGRTWSSEYPKQIGAMGKYLTTVWWSRLGASRHRMFRVIWSDNVPYRIVDAFLDPGQAIKSLRGVA